MGGIGREWGGEGLSGGPPYQRRLSNEGVSAQHWHAFRVMDDKLFLFLCKGSKVREEVGSGGHQDSKRRSGKSLRGFFFLHLIYNFHNEGSRREKIVISRRIWVMSLNLWQLSADDTFLKWVHTFLNLAWLAVYWPFKTDRKHLKNRTFFFLLNLRLFTHIPSHVRSLSRPPSACVVCDTLCGPPLHSCTTTFCRESGEETEKNCNKSEKSFKTLQNI